MIRKSFLSAVILVTAFCFTACGKPQTTNEIVTTSTTDTQVQTTPDALSTTEVEVTEQEVAEPTAEVTEEVAPVVEEEPANPEEATYETKWDVGWYVDEELSATNPDEWASRKPIVFGKWDCETKEFIELKDGDNVEMKNGDVICFYEFYNGDMVSGGMQIPDAAKYFDGTGYYDKENQSLQYYFEATNLPEETFEFSYTRDETRNFTINITKQ